MQWIPATAVCEKKSNYIISYLAIKSKSTNQKMNPLPSVIEKVIACECKI